MTGTVTIKQLVHLLSSQRRLGVAMAYGSVCQLIQKSNIDLQSVLKDGLVEMGLKHFPAIQTYDVHRNAVLSWSSRSGIWKIIGREENDVEFRSSAVVLSTLVRAALETRHIVYVSKLKKVPTTFPWIGECARKMSGENLSDEDLVKVLSFVSCVALLMNGWYVEYEQLEKLMRELPFNQYRMRDLEIQSKLLLSNFNTFKVFRLHHSIPFRMTLLEPKTATTQHEETAESSVNANIVVEGIVNRITEEDSVVNNQEVSLRAPTCLPASVSGKQRWTSKELEVLHDVWNEGRRQSVNMTSLYEAFKQKCMENDTPFRTMKAFAHKVSRL